MMSISLKVKGSYRYLALALFPAILALLLVSENTMGSQGMGLDPPKWIGINEFRGGINLRWFRVQGAAGYLVQRRVGDTGEYHMLAQVINPAYNDFNIATDQVYFYRIIPLDRNSTKGTVSEVRYIKLVSIEQGGVSPPQWGVHQIREEGIALSWQHEAYDKVLAYNLYRRREGEDSLTLITSSLRTAHLDRDVVHEVKYHYVVTALDYKLQESGDSTILEIKFTELPVALPESERLAKIRTIEEVVRKTELDRIYSWEKYGFVSPVDVEYHELTGQLYISDSGTGLITVIGPQGEVIYKLGGRGVSPREFDRLLGIAVDHDGYVYAVDAYRGEIVVFSPKGGFQKRIRLESEVRQYFGPGFEIRYPGFRFGIVDIEVASEGYLVVVDNPNGWIYVLDNNDTLVRVIGEKGDEPEEMQYPTFVIFDNEDRLIVSDTMNSRVQVFGSDGSHLKTVGEKGLGIGQFLRPKGVAADDAGNLYVADSQHNVIQVFNSEFEFIALLADEKGLPVDLGSPNGIAFVGPDHLAISERLSRRVQVRRLLPASTAVSSGEKVPQAGLSHQVAVGR